MTVQRVSLRRGAKTVEDIWKFANGVPARHSADDAVRERGERGVRIADLTYRKVGLELGMLKGNAFVITLRWVLHLLWWYLHTNYLQKRTSRLRQDT